METAIAQKLAELPVGVKLFADEFKKSGLPQQATSVLVGHSQSEYQWAVEYPEPVGYELASFEIRCECADIKNHSKALSYLTSAMALLRGFEPYEGIKPVVPLRYAPAGYSPQAGVWSYTGVVRAAIERPRDEYPLIAALPEIESVSIGLYREGYLQRQFEITMEVS